MITNMYGVGYNQDTLDAGMQVGDTLTVYDFAQFGFREVELVQAAEQLSANSALAYTEAGVVELVDAASDVCSGVNDVSGYSPTSGVFLGTGAIVLINNFFYQTIRGNCNPLLDAAVAALAPLQTGSATPGQLQAWAADAGATFKQTNMQALETSGAGGATLCRFY